MTTETELRRRHEAEQARIRREDEEDGYRPPTRPPRRRHRPGAVFWLVAAGFACLVLAAVAFGAFYERPPPETHIPPEEAPPEVDVPIGNLVAHWERGGDPDDIRLDPLGVRLWEGEWEEEERETCTVYTAKVPSKFRLYQNDGVWDEFRMYPGEKLYVFYTDVYFVFDPAIP